MAALAAATLMPGCGGGGEGGEAPFVPPAGALRATLLGATLASPWSLAFLPDGRMLVTQRGGSLVIVRADGSAVDAVVGGVPAVDASGQGGAGNLLVRIFRGHAPHVDAMGLAQTQEPLFGPSLFFVQVFGDQAI